MCLGKHLHVVCVLIVTLIIVVSAEIEPNELDGVITTHKSPKLIEDIYKTDVVSFTLILLCPGFKLNWRNNKSI